LINTVFKDGVFEGKVALVSGGGTGIGLRIAKELLYLGASVAIAGRKEEKLAVAMETLAEYGDRALSVVCNIREEEQVNACIDTVVEKYGKLDFLVNNAGGQFASPAESIKAKGWRAVIDTNLTGTFLMSQAAFNKSMNTNGGAIVNIIANMWNGFPILAHTGAARAGVDNLTKTLAVEWGARGVRINSVALGAIHSSGLNNYDPEYRKVFLEMAKKNKSYRLATEAEASAAVTFLLSPAAMFITGETLKVDGGAPLDTPMFPNVDHGKMPAFDDK
jgi:NAD(P)-dependent dehydrogenase (short-subunit alcohol dehydrogenase family)